MTRWQRRSKQVFKTHLKSLHMDEDLSSNPVSYHSGKAVYIPGASLYKEYAAAFEHIFCAETVQLLLLRIMST